MSKARKTRWVRLYTKTAENRFIKVKFSDARHAIDVPIVLSDELIEESKRGMPFECVIAKGILLAARLNPGLFPHPVLYVYVIRRTIYIVDKVNGQPIHAVRYQHDFSHLTKSFDMITKKAFRAKFGSVGFNLHTRPVVKRGGDELPGARETRARTHSVASAKPQESRGAYRRAVDAGFALPEPSVRHTAPRVTVQDRLQEQAQA